MGVCIEVREIDEFSLEITVKDAPFSEVHLLRETLIADVPTLAMGSFSFEGTTGFHAEALVKDRLELIPIKFSHEQYETFVEKDLDPLTFEIDISHDDPTNSQEELSVWSHQVLESRNLLSLMPGLEVARLSYGAKLRVVAQTFKGVGRTHAMFASTGVVTPVEERSDESGGRLCFSVDSIGGLEIRTIFSVGLMLMKQKVAGWRDVKIAYVE